MTPRERVAELQKRPGDGRCAIVVEGRGTGIPLDLVAARYLFGIETEGDGPYGFYTIRGPIPDPPKAKVRPFVKALFEWNLLICPNPECSWYCYTHAFPSHWKACPSCGVEFGEPQDLQEATP